MPFDGFSDTSFDDLIEKGFIEKAGVGADGKPGYRLTAKASDYLYKLDVLEALNQNSPSEIRKRIAKNN